MFLFCADPHFAAQAAAARDLGATVALLDHDALLSGDPAEVVRCIPAADMRTGTAAG